MITAVLMPQLGLEVTEATILEIHVSVGQRVDAGEPLIELETDKAITEVEASRGGVVVAIGVSVGGVVPVGAPLIHIADSAEEASRRPRRRTCWSRGRCSGQRRPRQPIRRRAAAIRGAWRPTGGRCEWPPWRAERPSISASRSSSSRVPVPAGASRSATCNRRHAMRAAVPPQTALGRDHVN